MQNYNHTTIGTYNRGLIHDKKDIEIVYSAPEQIAEKQNSRVKELFIGFFSGISLVYGGVNSAKL